MFSQKGFRYSKIRLPIYLALALLILLPCELQSAPILDLLPIVSGLQGPVAITHSGDGSGRLFIILKGGQVRIYNGQEVLPTPFLDISPLVSTGGEQGLLSVAFHPDYATNGFFFVNYTDTSGDTVIARYSVSADPDIADPDSAVIILTVSQPFLNHNGGQLQFGPDGYLYIGMGDGGSGGDPFNNAQNPGSLLGKMLRIDVNGVLPYSIPGDNPFSNEIWASGLRNPWRFSFDRLTGDLFIADVGQDNREELNFQVAGSAGGENYGWRLMEGTACFNPAQNCNDGSLTLPILEYDHSQGDCSITAGYRYRGSTFQGLQGIYFYGDLCTGKIWGAVQTAGAWTSALLLDTDLTISTFGEDEKGDLYVADFSGGAVYRIVDVSPVTPAQIPRYRLYNPHTGHHHFTTDTHEYDVLGTLGWIQEGISSSVFDGIPVIDAVSAVPFYRLYNPNSGDHLWTTDANEYQVLGTIGWRQEGVDGHVFASQVTGSQPLYRLYNPNAGLHHWTMDTNERSVIIGYGWKDEGIACYVFP